MNNKNNSFCSICRGKGGHSSGCPNDSAEEQAGECILCHEPIYGRDRVYRGASGDIVHASCMNDITADFPEIALFFGIQEETA